MLTTRIIQLSINSFFNPILFGQKKKNGWRFYVDYQVLNQVTILDKFLILTIDELLDELLKATIFSKLDLKSKYHQIYVWKDMEKRVFKTHDGHYELLVMSFGLSKTPNNSLKFDE